MKLKPIPANTVVHTPTEAEAKELLAILHENGYKWSGNASLAVETNWAARESATCYRIRNLCVTCQTLRYFKKTDLTILTLAEFKAKYCEEEKSLPKFKVGDKVIITGHSEYVPNIGVIAELHEIPASDKYPVDFGNFLEWIDAKFLKPYTDPETSPTKDMEAKQSHNLSQNSTKCDKSRELNLCELLKGHEGEMFYSPICGIDIELKEVFKFFLVFYLDKGDNCTIECETHGWQRIGTLDECGVFKSITYPDSACLIYPSRALYEQYPLDPYAAWMEWWKEQNKHWVSVTAWIDDLECESDIAIDTNKIHFHTPADRNKCIDEIKATIEKYSK